MSLGQLLLPGVAVLYGVLHWRAPDNLHPEDAVTRPRVRHVLQTLDRVARVHHVDVDQQQEAEAGLDQHRKLHHPPDLPRTRPRQD